MFSDNKLARQKLINKPIYKYTRYVWVYYFGTFIFEIIPGIARGIFLYGLLHLVFLALDIVISGTGHYNPIFWLTGDTKQGYNNFIIGLAALMAAYPNITSLLTIVPALFGKRILPKWIYWRQRVAGGERPSEREEEIISDVIKTFPEKVQQEIERRRARLGKRFEILVIDNADDEGISSVGDTIYITTGLLESRYLGALLARELSHVLSFDSQVELALARFKLYSSAPILRGAKAAVPHTTRQNLQASDGGRTPATTALGCFIVVLLVFGGGGLGVATFCCGWNWFRREREFDADQFAQTSGQGEVLTEYVQKYKVYDVPTRQCFLPVPRSEHRLERLRARAQGEAGEAIWPSYQKWVGVVLFFVVLAALTLAVLLIIPSTRDELYTYTPQGQATAQAIKATEEAVNADIDAGTAFFVGKWSVVEQPEITLIFLDNGRMGLRRGAGSEIYDNFLYYMEKKEFYWSMGGEIEYTVEVSADNNTVTLVDKSNPARNMTLKRLE